MPRLSKSDEQRRQIEFWKGGELPESVVRRHLAGIQRRREAEIAEKAGIRQKAARYLSQLQKPAERVKGEKANEALAGLQGLTKGLLKLKPLPKKPVIPPPPVWGRYTITFTPAHYEGSYTVGKTSNVTGNPTISATGNESLGQLTCMVETNYDKSSKGTASNQFHVYFTPLFANAVAQVSINSEISWSYYVNSIRNKEANATAQALVQISRSDGALIDQGALIGFDIDGLNNLDFNAYSGPGPWSSFLPFAVTSNFSYTVVVSLMCQASGSGWPGSLAGASAVVTVPSITVSVSDIPPNK